MKIGFVVVGHIKRQEQAEKLAADLGIKLFLDDGSLGEWENHKRAWSHLAKNYDYGVVLQDDALPVDNFLIEAQNAIYARPDECISFYMGTTAPAYIQGRIRMAVQKASAGKMSWIRSARLFWGVCVGLPTSVVPKLLDDHAKEVYDEHIGVWCMMNGIRVSYTFPSLVEHADGFSVVANRQPMYTRVAHRLGHQINPQDQREASFWMPLTNNNR